MAINTGLIYTLLSFASVGLLVYSIPVAVKILKHAPRGAMQQRWKILLVCIIGLAVCDLFLALNISDREPDNQNLVVLAVFFCAAVFVLVTLDLYKRTNISAGKDGTLAGNDIMDNSCGIYNLRYFEIRLQEEFERARRYNIPLTLLLMEIDNFQKTSSSSGRFTSAKAFGAICKLIKESSRTSDILARYGGDQLIMLLPHSALYSAKQAGDKFRELVQNKVLDQNDINDAVTAARLNYTVSIGIANFQEDVKAAGELIRRADIALNKAKDKGKNKVVIYGE